MVLTFAELVEEAKQVAASGLKEIVITGINTGDFGRTTGEKFIDLLRALNDVEGIERYRISSIHTLLRYYVPLGSDIRYDLQRDLRGWQHLCSRCSVGYFLVIADNCRYKSSNNQAQPTAYWYFGHNDWFGLVIWNGIGEVSTTICPTLGALL